MADEKSIGVIWFFLKDYQFSFLFLSALGVLMAVVNMINLALLYPILSISTNQTYQPNNLLFSLISLIENLFAGLFAIQDPLIASSLLFMLAACFSFFLNAVFVWVSLKITTEITIYNKEKLFDKYESSDYQRFIDSKQGDIIYRLTRAPQYIAEVLSNLTKLSVDILISVSTVLLLFSITVYGTILFLAAGTAYYIFTRYLSCKISYLTGTGRYQANENEIVTLNEYINGVKQIKASESSPFWKKHFTKSVWDYWVLWEKDAFWLQIPPLVLYLLIFITIGSVIIAIKIFYPASFIAYLPVLGTFSLSVLTLLPKLANFGNYQMAIMGALPNLSLVRQVFEDTKYSTIKNGSKIFSGKKPEISFDQVKFYYHENTPLLRDVHLTIEAGKTTAIVGESGSGKSTMIDLLLRLYDVGEGRILINNIDIRDYDLATLRNKIGFVSQDTFIFNASIRENITFGQEYSDEEIMRAASLANVHNFVDRMPQKYDTVVGDRGMRLSGGERQRIAIARAIIRNPEILILDEATSSLDTVSEKIVQDAISNVAQTCTTVIVAHRLSTIINADMIYVINKGRIIESGTHQTLIERKGEYWKMYNVQMNPDS
ncbi:ABC transporter ATP-binding protein [Methanoregula formicica]|uniref:ABC-type multidrug transport system, ATPase and permease component n=1 Tax=Methanoregula formicica (strain DSM 22288 / NBRC 105244 / SMSP) TaxID=593750 RepID=L0HEB6_METFS|nr:ABC transporter ATP-binding protein [Methanoregula formicica]AGB02355.1 ABC-type multidrug transport system, ATPase and permease component [Methanoregula formicica SMSP]